MWLLVPGVKQAAERRDRDRFALLPENDQYLSGRRLGATVFHAGPLPRGWPLRAPAPVVVGGYGPAAPR